MRFPPLLARRRCCGRRTFGLSRCRHRHGLQRRHRELDRVPLFPPLLRPELLRPGIADGALAGWRWWRSSFLRTTTTDATNAIFAIDGGGIPPPRTAAAEDGPGAVARPFAVVGPAAEIDGDDAAPPPAAAAGGGASAADSRLAAEDDGGRREHG